MLLKMSIAIVEKKKNPASWKPGGIRSPGIRLPEPEASRRLNTSGKDGGREENGRSALARRGSHMLPLRGKSVLLRIRVKGRAVVFPGRTPGISTGKHAPLTLQESQALTLEKLLVCSLL